MRLPLLASAQSASPAASIWQLTCLRSIVVLPVAVANCIVMIAGQWCNCEQVSLFEMLLFALIVLTERARDLEYCDQQQRKRRTDLLSLVWNFEPLTQSPSYDSVVALLLNEAPTRVWESSIDWPNVVKLWVLLNFEIENSDWNLSFVKALNFRQNQREDGATETWNALTAQVATKRHQTGLLYHRLIRRKLDQSSKGNSRFWDFTWFEFLTTLRKRL